MQLIQIHIETHGIRQTLSSNSLIAVLYFQFPDSLSPSNYKLENVAIAGHCNLRPPGLPPDPPVAH